MKIKGIAYSGGLVEDHPFFPDGLKIDSSALEIPPKIPLLFNHYSNEVVGHAVATVGDDGQIVLEGEIYDGLPSADNIVETAKKGFPWQLSVGVAIDDWMEDKSGRFTITKGALREVSVTPIGADRKTSLEPINASAVGGGDEKPAWAGQIVELSASLTIDEDSNMDKNTNENNEMAAKVAELEAKIAELEAVNAELNQRLIEASIADAPASVKKLILATAKTPEEAKQAYDEIMGDLKPAPAPSDKQPGEPVHVQASTGGDVKDLMLKAIKGGK